MKNPILTTTAIAIGLMTNMGSADIFHTITDIAAPGMIDGSGANPLSNVIQGAGVGFDTNLPHEITGVPTANVWYTTGAGANYITGHGGDEKLLFDLGADVALGEISVWGYSAGNGNGLREFNVSFATDAEGGVAGLGDETYGTSIVLNPSHTAALDPVPRQSFRFGELVTARYVEVWVTSNYAGGVGGVPGGDRLGVGEIAFALATVAGAPDIEIADVSFAFAETPANYDIPVTNTGELDLNISTPTFSGTNSAAFGVVTTPGAIGTWDSQNVVVSFDPTGLSGEISATMTIASDDPDESPVDVQITGVVGPIIEVASSVTLSLGDSVETFDIDIENLGSTDLDISGTDFIGANSGAFSTIFVPATIASDVLDIISIQFDPTGLEPGPIDATLRIMSNDPATPTAEVIIIGGVPRVFHTIVDVTTNTTEFFDRYNLIQGPGFSVGFDDRWPHNAFGEGPGATWVTDNRNGNADYFDGVKPDPVLTFDLGGDLSINEISTWGYANSNTNGAKDFTLRFATEADGPTGFGTSITYSPSFDAAFSATTRDSHMFGRSVTARYVEMTITDNWRGLAGVPGGDRVGLGEVSFENRAAITPTPEFKILSGGLAGASIDLIFESIEGAIYDLDRSTDTINWERLPDTAVGGPGTTSTISDTAPLADPVVLYRVINTGQTAP